MTKIDKNDTNAHKVADKIVVQLKKEFPGDDVCIDNDYENTIDSNGLNIMVYNEDEDVHSRIVYILKTMYPNLDYDIDEHGNSHGIYFKKEALANENNVITRLRRTHESDN